MKKEYIPYATVSVCWLTVNWTHLLQSIDKTATVFYIFLRSNSLAFISLRRYEQLEVETPFSLHHVTERQAKFILQ